MSVLDRSHPVSHCFVNCVSQCARSAGDWPNFGTHGPHDKNVQFLTANIFFAHVHHAWQAESSTRCRCSDPVLTSSRFGNDPLFSHSEGKQRLSDRIIDLVSTGVVQIFTLEVDLCPATSVRQSLGEVQWVWPTNECMQQAVELLLERRVSLGFGVFNRQFFQGMHQRFRDESPTEFTESTFSIGDL